MELTINNTQPIKKAVDKEKEKKKEIKSKEAKKTKKAVGFLKDSKELTSL